MNNYEIYRAAAAGCQEGWTRFDFHDDKKPGNRCMVQHVLDNAVEEDWAVTLPHDIAAEIHHFLHRHYLSYRLLGLVGAQFGWIRQELIQRWNDFLGTQGRVADALNRLADEKELEFLREENLHLRQEVARLQALIDNTSDHNELLCLNRHLDLYMADFMRNEYRLGIFRAPTSELK